MTDSRGPVSEGPPSANAGRAPENLVGWLLRRATEHQKTTGQTRAPQALPSNAPKFPSDMFRTPQISAPEVSTDGDQNSKTRKQQRPPKKQGAASTHSSKTWQLRREATVPEASKPGTVKPVNAEETSHTEDNGQKHDASVAVQATAAAYRAKSQTKVVIRNLPPKVLESDLLATLPQEFREILLWSSLIPGQVNPVEGEKTSAWFLNFESAAAAESVSRLYSGRVFTDSTYSVYRAVGRLAPFQKVPKSKGSSDKREGTIFEDPAYSAFLEPQAGATRTTMKPQASIPTIVDDEGVQLSPLLMELRQKHGQKTFVNKIVYTSAMLQQHMVGGPSV